MFKKVIGGGACNSSEQAQACNPLTKFIDDVIRSRKNHTTQSYATDKSDLLMDEMYEHIRNQQKMTQFYESQTQFNDLRIQQPRIPQVQDLNDVWDNVVERKLPTRPWIGVQRVPIFYPSQQLHQDDGQCRVQVALSMIEILETSENPKHRNCKLLKFLKRVKEGTYTIRENKVLKHGNKEADQLMRDLQMIEQFQAQGFGYGAEEEESVLDITTVKSQEYGIAKAKLLISSQVKSPSAQQFLESQVTTDPENSETWRLLGQIYQENDLGELAIHAFQKAITVDPYDLDSLFQLGSCTNDHVYLHQWLKQHPDYQDTPVSDNFVSLKNSFQNCLRMRTNDTKVLMALGILNLIEQDYNAAGEWFSQAIKITPNDYTLWNKYAECMSFNHDLAMAIQAYERAIILNPQYVKAMVSVGLAFSKLKQLGKAANFFIKALTLNSTLSHVWTQLRQTFITMNRFDLIERLELKDPLLFSDELLRLTEERLYTNEIL